MAHRRMSEDHPGDDRSASDDRPATEDCPADEDQYGAVTTGDGETIVYDRGNPDAWIQSSLAVEVGPDLTEE